MMAIEGLIINPIFPTTRMLQSGFLVHHLISSWLARADTSRVVIVGLEHTFGHYHGVAAARAGPNLLKLRQAGRVVFYEGLRLLPALLETEAGDEATLVRALHRDLGQLAAAGSLVVLDQVSVLRCLGLSAGSVYLVCHQLAVLLAGLQDTQLVIRMFEQQQPAPASPGLVPLVTRLASLHLSVSGLETGLSKDVSGVLNISTPESDTRTLHFKFVDKDVKIFARGTSSAVL